MSQSNRKTDGFTQDKAVWYEDGNIVLIAGGTAFKLYKGILTSVSPVFKDMFSLANPDADPGEPCTVDGCPAVRLTDSPRDLRCFLCTITTTFVVLLDRNTLVPFAKLAATVRIAHKYQAQQVLQATASRLRAFFSPDVIAELHAQSTTHDTWTSFWNQKQYECGVLVPLTGATGVEAVSIARLLGDNDMLPLALLLCCAYAKPLELRNGVERGDGTVVKLSDSDYLGCVQATPALTRMLHTLGGVVMHECARATPVGGHHAACKKVLVAMGNKHLKEPSSGPLMDGFVWFQWRSSLPKAYAEYAQAVCDKCYVRLEQTFRETFADLTLHLGEESSYIHITLGSCAK